MAGESGGVFGVKVAVGDGGASTFERKRARRSTTMALAHCCFTKLYVRTYPVYSCEPSRQSPCGDRLLS